jgi:flavin-dependent dehydrogenase
VSTPRYPAVVAGGGAAGAAAALALVRAGRRVLLVDDSAGEFRVGEALPPWARPLLRDLGVLDRFLADGHLPCHGNLAAWGGGEVHATDFVRTPHGHGWHLDRARFDALLRDAAREAGADLRAGVRVREVERAGPRWRVRLDAEEVECDWLVDATGRRSTVARRLGASRLREDALVAFYARFRTDAPDRDSRTLVEAGPDGWWYTALLPAGERVVAFMTDADLAPRAELLTREGFAARLAESTHVREILRAHGYLPDGRVRGAEAASARLSRCTGPGWAAVGDAALSLDPLSSQGILNALYTGKRAGEAIHRALSGDGSALAEYESRVAEIHRAYHHHRAAYYGDERRWEDRPFWHRRAPAAPVAA